MYQFENDELGYREWLRLIRHGFVLNYRVRDPEPDNLILGGVAKPHDCLGN